MHVAGGTADLIEQGAAVYDARLQVVFCLDFRRSRRGRLADENGGWNTRRLLAGEMTLRRNAQQRDVLGKQIQIVVGD